MNLGEVSVVKNRKQLREELGARQSGGFYICTIQKFCDREDDKIGLSMIVRILYVFLTRLIEHNLSIQRRFSSAKMLTKI